MPCGGIYPIKPEQGECYYCGQRGKIDHWCEEWDALIHGKCVEAFLKTEEGQIILSHGHPVNIIKDGKNIVIATGSDFVKPVFIR